jgi:hypothetical protein
MSNNIWNDIVGQVEALDPGFTPENAANKANDLSVDSAVLFPTTHAVIVALALLTAMLSAAQRQPGIPGRDADDPELPMMVPGPAGAPGPQGLMGIAGRDAEESEPATVMVLPPREWVWSSWSPTWTNLSVGNGSVTARFIQIGGRLVICRVTVVFGSSTSVSGDIQFTKPVDSVAYAGVAGVSPLGIATAYDLSDDRVYEGVVANYSTTKVATRFHLASGTYVTRALTTIAIPFTWAAGDELHAQFAYEA